MATQLADLEHALVAEAHAGRLQRSLALVAGLTGGMSGLEVGYMHYRAGYGNRIMWTPVVMTQALAAAGIAAAMRPRLARTLLPAVSALTLADCGAGWFFHIRGISRKPGGWRLVIPNLAMGPPLFAPLLLGISAYLGVLAARMQPEFSATQIAPELRATLHDHLAAATGIATLCSGGEALYSHYKNNFRYAAQWTPIALAPALAAAAFRDCRPRWLLPVLSLAAMADGAAGFFYHTRGVLRRSGGSKHLIYNIIYGPPVLAPLLFAACGFFGLLATALRKKP
ncbi:MAG: hypothetical protein ACRD0Y_06635 [Terriglobales bacterium]